MGKEIEAQKQFNLSYLTFSWCFFGAFLQSTKHEPKPRKWVNLNLQQSNGALVTHNNFVVMKYLYLNIGETCTLCM